MGIEIYKTSFEDFLLYQEQSKSKYVYRGQHLNWELSSTLYRFLKKKEELKLWAREISTGNFCSIQKRILSDKAVKESDNISNANLINPFIIGMLYADEKHKAIFKNFFRSLIEMRHLGSYSPLIDWTKNPKIAIWFALHNNDSIDPIVIWRLQVKPKFDPFPLQIHLSDFCFSEEEHKHFRHNAQESVYTLAMEHPHRDTYLPLNERKGPNIILRSYDEITLPDNVVLEKYIITNTKGQNAKKDFLEKLNITYQDVYGSEDPLESKDHNGEIRLHGIEESIYLDIIDCIS